MGFDTCMIYWTYFPQDCNLVVAQGILEAVRISLAGYPTRRTYAEFVDRFGVDHLDLAKYHTHGCGART
jgi:hypothetical protein